MAALFLKTLLFPRESHQGRSYAPLRPSTPDTPRITDIRDLEQGRATSTDSDSASSSSSTLFDETMPYNNEKISHSASSPSNAHSSVLFSSRINPRIISDATIGLSDGLTVPFALTAGLSALGDTQVVIYGGLAELIAGGISMGLGGYLGAKSEAEAYQAALAETKAIVANDSQTAARLVREAFGRYEFEEEVLEGMVESLRRSGESVMVEFLMRFHHALAEADFKPEKAYLSGVTIAAGYVVGGLVALLPYLFVESVGRAFVGSVVVMAVALFVFGWTKTALVGESDRWIRCKNGMQMIVLGGVAAGAAMGCVKAIG